MNKRRTGFRSRSTKRKVGIQHASWSWNTFVEWYGLPWCRETCHSLYQHNAARSLWSTLLWRLLTRRESQFDVHTINSPVSCLFRNYLIHRFSFDNMPEEISTEAKSGNGSVENVGVKMSDEFPCKECRQLFETQKALDLHWRLVHDPNRHQENWDAWGRYRRLNAYRTDGEHTWQRF